MQIKTLTTEDLREIYYVNMVHEFPEAELKPFAAIDKLLQRNMYLCFGLFEDETLEGYAFLVREDGNDQLLLDYYVVLEEFRDQGLGTSFMTMLRAACKDYAAILVEVADPDYAADDTDLAARKRRISFYERNGYKDTGIRNSLYGADYRIMQRKLSLEGPDVPAYPGLDALYHEILGDQYGIRLQYRTTGESQNA